MQVARQLPLHRLPGRTKAPCANLDELAHNYLTGSLTQSAQNQEQEILQIVLKQSTRTLRPHKISLTK